jgi:hypothetical protein
MLVISSKEFRDNPTQYFNRVDSGESVIIQRGKKKSYAISAISEDDAYFTPEMIEKIEQALAQVERGEGVLCKTYEDSLRFLESL